VSIPTTDRGGIQQAIRALLSDGWKLDSVFDTEEDIPVNNETEAIEAIEAVGLGHLHVTRDNDRGWVFFVLGNDPDEVICDYTTNLDIIDKLTDGWY
jgi:hypothetical protein